jgi:type I restriction enzyme, S subunit
MSITWRAKRLSELCNIEIGKTPSRADKKFWDDRKTSGNVWLSIADLLTAEDNIVTDSKEYLTPSGASLCKVVRRGTLLVSFKLTLGRLAFAGRDLYTNEAIAALTIRDEYELSKEFLFYFLQYFDWHKATEGDVKLKGKTLNKAKLQEIEVLFPPLAEQKRIVIVLKRALEVIDKVNANFERCRMSAQSIFEANLSRVFECPDSSWVEMNSPLAELCDLIVDCEHKTAPCQVEGIPSIRTPNVGRGKLLLQGVNRVSDKTYKEWTRRAEPTGGDLILAREAPAGNVAVVPSNLRLCLGQRTVLIRPKRSLFEPAFLAYTLLQPRMQEALLAHSRGATVEHVNMKEIRALRIGAIPTPAVQKGIVEQIESVAARAEALTAIVAQKIRATEALRRSLLHHAFVGAL